MRISKEIENILKILDKAVVEKVIVYDMRTITPFFDYSIIGSVNSSRQGNAAIDYLRKEAPQLGMDIRGYSASMSGLWFLADLGNVIIHLFVAEERARYNMDGLYSQLDNKTI